MDARVLLDIDPPHASLLVAAARAMFDRIDGDVQAIPMDRKSGRFHVYRLRVVRAGDDPTRSCYVKVGDLQCSQERQKELQRLIRSEFVSWLHHVCNESSFQTMKSVLVRINATGTPETIKSLCEKDVEAFNDGDLHCLCYSAVGTSESEPVPLADLLREPLNEITAPLVKAAITRVHALQASWRKSSKASLVDGTSFATEYEAQLRWELDHGGRGTKRFLEQWIGIDGKDKHASLLFELGLACPWDTVLRLIANEKNERLRQRPNHGDLHQRNIMIERAAPNGGSVINQAYLIDFESTKPQHWLCDSVTLEASLKLFDCAAHFSESEFLALHDALDGEHELATVDEHQPGRYLWEILSQIRSLSWTEARDIGIDKEKWRHEYYVASLFVTLGMMSMSGCPARLGYLTAAWMARHILDT